MDVKYEDKDLSILLLCSPPSSFASFCDTILLSYDEQTILDVYEALQSMENMKGMVHPDGSSSKCDALQVRGKSEQRSSDDSNDLYKSQESRGCSKSRPPKKFYKYCKKKTHFIEECWKLKNKEKRKNNLDGKASIVSDAGSDSGDCLVVLAGCVSGHDEWILDSACSFHICTNRDWFSSFKPV
jgi:hypothetical protein